MELREQGDELQRVEESMVAQVRVMDVLQRAAHKQQRQMDVDRATLDHQQALCEATTARLVHERQLLGVERVKLKSSLTTARHRRERESSVSVLVPFFGFVSFVFMRDSLIPLPF